MHKSKLISLIRSLRPEEFHWCQKFLKSPFYNSHELPLSLFQYISRYLPDLDSPKLAKAITFRKLFPGEPYDLQKMRKAMHRLADLLEEFLLAMRLRDQPLQKAQLLLDAFGDRNLYDQFEKKTSALIEALEALPYRDEHFYLSLWRLQYEQFFHPQTRRLQFSSESLRMMMQNLDAFYILSKMRYSAELRNRQNILPEAYEIALLKEARQLAENHPVFGPDEIFQTYRDILALMEQPEDEDIYRRLEGIAFYHLHRFRPTDQSYLLRYLINTCIQWYNNGKTEYLERQFRLYQLGLDAALFLEEGRLSDSTFLNIIVTATVLKELAWVEGFIAQYAPHLPLEHQVDAVSLGTAYWYFAKARFSASNNLLRQVESTDLQYLLRVRSLSLRNHFEIFLRDDTYYELWMDESEAFKKFLRRNKQLIDTRVESYLKLIYFLRKLTKWRMEQQMQEKQLLKLDRELLRSEKVVAKQWLLEKISSLKK